MKYAVEMVSGAMIIDRGDTHRHKDGMEMA
jgi:hypothetical protein